jgi:hypothetical protein
MTLFTQLGKNNARTTKGVFNVHDAWPSSHSWVRTMHVLQKRSLTYMTHEPLHTHVTHYGPRVGFPYYNLTLPSPSSRRHLYPPSAWGHITLWVGTMGTFTSTRSKENENNLSTNTQRGHVNHMAPWFQVTYNKKVDIKFSAHDAFLE